MSTHSSPLRHAPKGLALLVLMLASGAWGVPDTCASESADPETDGPHLHFEDGLLTDPGLREELIKYLDSNEPTNPLGVVMVPAPLSLAERFRDALARLGAGSSRTSAFPQLALAAWANGTGALPGKAVGAVSKDCHEDYEVDSGFQIDNVVGPTDGRVGILYLSGGGEVVLVDEATGDETRQEVKPGRFMSWRNTGHKHCVADNSGEPRRFLGPLVLDASRASFIPVVDILAGPGQPCTSASDPSLACVDGVLCTPSGGAATPSSFCCSGAIYWYPGHKCCNMIGTAASKPEQCCSNRLIDSVCAPPGDLSCLAKCKQGAQAWYRRNTDKCRDAGRGPRRQACEEVVAANMHMHLAYCISRKLPHRC